LTLVFSLLPRLAPWPALPWLVLQVAGWFGAFDFDTGPAPLLEWVFSLAAIVVVAAWAIFIASEYLAAAWRTWTRLASEGRRNGGHQP